MKKIYQSTMKKEFSGTHSQDIPLVKNGQVLPEELSWNLKTKSIKEIIHPWASR